MENREILKQLREQTNLNRKEFAEYINIPLRTIEDWEAGRRTPPEYLMRLLSYYVELEVKKRALQKVNNTNNNRRVNIVKDLEGNSIVLIHDIRFKGKRKIQWKEVKEYLKEYVGDFYTIADTKDIIYIGKDLPGEYSGSKYTNTLKGANAKAKANAVQGLPELIEIATNKHFRENQGEKHKKDAKYGWYRYDSRFALPIYDEKGEVERYNVFHTSMLVRYAQDKKLYLYDIIDIKKETSNSFKS